MIPMVCIVVLTFWIILLQCHTAPWGQCREKTSILQVLFASLTSGTGLKKLDPSPIEQWKCWKRMTLHVR